MDKQKFIEEAGDLEMVIADRVRSTKIVPAILVVFVCKLVSTGVALVINPMTLAKDPTMTLNVAAVTLLMTLAVAYITWVLSFGYRMQPMTPLKIGKRMYSLSVLTLLSAIIGFAVSAFSSTHMSEIEALKTNPASMVTSQNGLIFIGLAVVAGILALVLFIYTIMILVDMVKFKLPLYKPSLILIIGSIIIGAVTGGIVSGASVINPNVETNSTIGITAQIAAVLNSLLYFYLLYCVYKLSTRK
ncbi:MAG TPA: hypothetical protein PLK40_06045 [Bacteroidaceae bacterium]|nr:hypothetical protein [Bacteroidaceae bacterium]